MASEIKTNAIDNKTSMCKICYSLQARYCCPRCNILYCSLSCYQSNVHLQCSECFYKENVLTEINVNRKEKSREKMLDVLQSFNEFADENSTPESLDSDDDNYVDIAERLSGVNLENSDEVWLRLTHDEKEDFVAFLKSEDVSKFIPVWKPWWLNYNDSLVQDISSNKDIIEKCPQICTIKNFSDIMTQAPSTCVKYNLVNIISAYTFTARYFNGEHFDFIEEAVTCITSLSLTLKYSENFKDFETAVKSVEQECINNKWITADKDNFKMMQEDLIKILGGPTKSDNKTYLLSALSDIYNLFTALLRIVKTEKLSNGSRKITKKYIPSIKTPTAANVKKHIRKIDYYLSYTRHCYEK